MIVNLGYGALVITLGVAVYGIVAALIGMQFKKPAWVDSARNAMLLTWPLLTVVALSLIYLLVTGHYELKFVSAVTSNSMPFYLRVTALWGGQAGSLLFWSWLMSAFASAVTLRKWARDREFLPWVVIVLLVTLTFFLILNVFVENPFQRWWQTPLGEVVGAVFPPAGATLFTPRDGSGLNPLLRHPGMIIHPPMLYLGFVSLVIPYAFAIASLVTGRSDDRWIRITRRWTLVAWLFLSLGLILGSRWAYDVLGWGGYWAWDPVEIAAFMPWLTGTAFLHSVMIQEKRGMLKHWNMLLIIITYDLVIYGTFLTRSGVIDSVHSFARSAIGPLFFTFIVATFVASVLLLAYRWNMLKAENQLDNILSREGLFLVNNLLFILITAVCFLGVNFPIFTEALGVVGQNVRPLAGLFTGQKVTVGPEWYERINAPLFLVLLLLMGIAPLSAWGHSTWKTLGRAIWKPALPALVVMILMTIYGVGGIDVWFVLKLGGIPVFLYPIIPFAFGVITLVTFVTLFEFGRAALARRRAHGENFLLALWKLIGRDRRRYGGYTIHLGVVMMALGIIGIEVFQTQTQGTLRPGEMLTLGHYAVRYDSLAEFPATDGRQVARAVVTVFRDGAPLRELYPRSDFYPESQQSMNIAGVRSTIEDDLYVVLVDWQPISTDGATFKVYHNPLINWLWLGGIVFILGTLVAAWPDKDPEMAVQRVARLAEERVRA